MNQNGSVLRFALADKTTHLLKQIVVQLLRCRVLDIDGQSDDVVMHVLFVDTANTALSRTAVDDSCYVQATQLCSIQRCTKAADVQTGFDFVWHAIVHCELMSNIVLIGVSVFAILVLNVHQTL